MPKEYLDLAQLVSLKNAAKNDRDRLLIHLLERLGCRVSEELALSVDDIDFINAKVNIVHLKSHVWLTCKQCNARLGLRHDFCPECGNKNDLNLTQRSEKRRQRLLPVDSETLDLIRKYIDSGAPVNKNGKMYLFGINRHRAWQIIRNCARRAGLPSLVNPETGRTRGVSPHRLRDAFAVHAMKVDDSGEGMRMLQEHLGHASFNTTARYRKVASEEHQNWYKKLWKQEGEN
jgi:integrase/recombinase XerD